METAIKKDTVDDDDNNQIAHESKIIIYHLGVSAF